MSFILGKNIMYDDLQANIKDNEKDNSSWDTHF